MKHLRHFIFLTLLNFVYSNCIWYDKCGSDPEYKNDGIHELNCFSKSQEPIQVQDLKLLRKTCPHFNESKLCCSESQLKTALQSFKLSESILGNCPTCIYNFKRFLCDITCHPNQSSFVSVVETVNGTAFNGSNVEMVKRIQVSVSQKSINTIYDSCKDVYSSIVSGSVMKLACGSWGSVLCTAKRWFDFLGSVQNGYAPFQIDYITNGSSQYNETFSSCNESPASNIGPCSCSDCPKVCLSSHFTIPVEEPTHDYELAFYLSLHGIYLLGLLGLAFLVMSQKREKQHDDDDDNNNKQETLSLNWKQRRNNVLSGLFTKWGTFVAKHALTVIFITTSIALACSCGLFYLEITTDPIKLWASSTSRARIEKRFFDEHFTPFYRVSQIIFSEKEESSPFSYVDVMGNNVSVSGVLTPEFLLQILKLQNSISNLRIENVTLEDICFRPLSPENPSCFIQNIWAYWQDSVEELNKIGISSNFHRDTYLDHLLLCTQNPTSQQSQTAMSQSCVSRGGIPVEPTHVLGGYKFNPLTQLPEYTSSRAIILTILLDNENDGFLDKKLSWEKGLIKHLQEWTASPNMRMSYLIERSIEDELDKESKGDVSIILLSYVLMIFYVIISLGQVRFECPEFFLVSKMTLGLFSIALLILSILSTIGIFCYIGIPSTLFVFEIIPFLVLAVGIDNIFILTKYVRDIPRRKLEEEIGVVIGSLGPSMLQSTLSQALAFYLGAFSDMPAIQIFALYAATTLVFNFLMQMSLFVAILTLDMRREVSESFDVLCCIKNTNKNNTKNNTNKNENDENANVTLSKSFFTNPLNSLYCQKGLYRVLFDNLLIQILILFLFLLSLSVSIMYIPKIPLGLEPSLSMPHDSYVLDYFVDYQKYLNIGPPVYFVINSTGVSLNFSDEKLLLKLCEGSRCNSNSLVSTIKSWSKESKLTYLGSPAKSWIDDYVEWKDKCCKMNESGEICRGNESKSSEEYLFSSYDYFLPSEDSSSRSCSPCSETQRPFLHSLEGFLNENPSQECPKGGKALYRKALSYNQTSNEVFASHFASSHVSLKSNQDYIEALIWARKLSDNLTSMIDTEHVNVFPYSIFYIFYEQYLSIQFSTLLFLFISLLSIFANSLLFSDVTSGLILFFFILSILINLGGIMYIWNISLNAISMMNLIMTAGLSVEFGASIINNYSGRKPERDRVKKIFGELIPILFSGIHVTNFISVIILVFANSKIFTIFYFRMYFGTVVLGAVHGLIVLPVFLSFLDNLVIK